MAAVDASRVFAPLGAKGLDVEGGLSHGEDASGE